MWYLQTQKPRWQQASLPESSCSERLFWVGWWSTCKSSTGSLEVPWKRISAGYFHWRRISLRWEYPGRRESARREILQLEWKKFLWFYDIVEAPDISAVTTISRQSCNRNFKWVPSSYCHSSLQNIHTSIAIWNLSVKFRTLLKFTSSKVLFPLYHLRISKQL